MTDAEHRPPRLLAAGDSAIVIEFGDGIDPDTNRRVYRYADAVEAESFPGVRELVPTYRSLLIHYDPLQTTFRELRGALAALVERADPPAADSSANRGAVYELPVVYGGDSGPDLADVAAHAGLTEDEVIAIHSGVAYRVYMLGFLPGFPYLGGMDPRIACPRLKSPRLRVPAGSVGIAESQTGVYPMDSPGGWRLIGHTPAPLFDPANDPPVAILPGSDVRFVSVSPAEADAIRAAVSDGSYRLRRADRQP